MLILVIFNKKNITSPPGDIDTLASGLRLNRQLIDQRFLLPPTSQRIPQYGMNMDLIWMYIIFVFAIFMLWLWFIIRMYKKLKE